jgi:hypothetical protein
VYGPSLLETRLDREGNAALIILIGAVNQVAHNLLMAKKSWSQSRKPLNPDLPSLTGHVNCPLSNGPCHKVMNRHRYPKADKTQRRDFLTWPEIHLTGGSNPGPRVTAPEPQPTELRTFALETRMCVVLNEVSGKRDVDPVHEL